MFPFNFISICEQQGIFHHSFNPNPDLSFYVKCCHFGLSELVGFILISMAML